jgi:hypothetical protein
VVCRSYSETGDRLCRTGCQAVQQCDGGDKSSRYTENEIKNLVKEADVQIYAIGIYEPIGTRSRTPEELFGPGGWSTSSLVIKTWKRLDGTALETKSDGYGTGLASFVLQRAGISPTQSQLKRALTWLEKNQDPQGFWPAYSLNKQQGPASDAGRFMSDAATAYSVLALTQAK